MKNHSEFNETLFSQLFTKNGKNALFYSESERFIKSLKNDFPEIISIDSIGNSV
jgi:hypothetical protein